MHMYINKISHLPKLFVYNDNTLIYETTRYWERCVSEEHYSNMANSQMELSYTGIK